MLKRLKMFSVFTTKPKLDDLVCDGKSFIQSRRRL
jgi:hypothetical protein